VLAVQDGLTLAPHWFDRLEGPYTCLAKLAIANSLSIDAVMKHVFCESGKLEGKSGRGTRTWLAGEWMRPARSQSGNSLALDLRDRCLAQSLEMDVKDFAGDKHFRYCPACLDRGFQSPLCQIDGLARCPIHLAPIINSCRRCGEPTGRYGNDAYLRRRLRCIKCAVPLGYAWGDDGLLRWEVSLDTGPYDRLRSTLKELKKFKWLDRGGWDQHFEHLSSGQRRVANLGFAVEALGLSISSEVLDPAITRGHGQAIHLQPGLPLNTGAGNDAAFREPFVLVWHEFLRRRGLGTVVNAIRNETLKLDARARAVEWVGSKDAELLAMVLWCKRFCRWQTEPDLRFKRNQPAWAVQLNFASEVWAGYLALALKGERRFAEKWCEIVGNLNRGDQAWREQLTQYGMLLRSDEFQSMGTAEVEVATEDSGASSSRAPVVSALGSSYFPL
jgi:hypothetical protein